MEKAKEVKRLIKKKFINVSRFSQISGISYHRIVGAIKRNDPIALRKVMDAAENLENRTALNEISPDLANRIRQKLYLIRNLKVWAVENKVPYYWLMHKVLEGTQVKARFKDGILMQRVIKALKIKE